MGVEQNDVRNRRMVVHARIHAMTDMMIDVMTGVAMKDVMTGVAMMGVAMTGVMMTSIGIIGNATRMTGVIGEIEMIITLSAAVSTRIETFIEIDLRNRRNIILMRTKAMVGPVSHIGVGAATTFNVTPHE